MFKNVASQKIMVFAFDSTTNLPKTGDSANITAYVSKDFGAVTVLTDTSATEIDATNAKGYYWFDVSQTETNADALIFSAKSSTANIVVIGVPAVVYTTPPNFTLQSIDSNGRLDVIKVAGTTQTARDLGASVLLSSGTGAGQISLSSGLVTLAGVTHTGAVIPTVTDLTNAPTNGDLTATMKTSVTTAATAATPTAAAVTGSVGSVVGLTASNLDATISSRLATAGYTAPDNASISAILVDTAEIGAAGAGLTAIGDTRIANLDAAVSTRLASSGYTAPPSAATNASAVRSELTTELGRIDVATSTRLASASYTAADNAGITAIKAKTDNLPASPAATGDIPSAAAIASTALTTQMTESYAADGVAPTLAQAILLIQQALSEFSIAGTTITVKKLDGTATAATLTINDATTPTAVTRAT